MRIRRIFVFKGEHFFGFVGVAAAKVDNPARGADEIIASAMVAITSIR
jgi:hypothetical protein